MISTGCIIYRMTGICCPVCGTTRAWLYFFAGDFINAFAFNPFFIVIPFFIFAYVHINTKFIKKIKYIDKILLIFAIILFTYNILREIIRLI